MLVGLLHDMDAKTQLTVSVNLPRFLVDIAFKPGISNIFKEVNAQSGTYT